MLSGEPIAAESKVEYPVYNPANGQVVNTAPKGDTRDVQCAVGAAERAFPNHGLGSSAWTRVLNKANLAAEQLETGEIVTAVAIPSPNG